jgi:DNA-binding GntR family transcriptional regulator
MANPIIEGGRDKSAGLNRLVGNKSGVSKAGMRVDRSDANGDRPGVVNPNPVRHVMFETAFPQVDRSVGGIPAPEAIVTEKIARNALRHEFARRLLDGIVTGRIPALARPKIMELAASLGTSSTPVRESLIELEGIGMVEFVHNRGVKVKPFGPEQLREVYHLRRILETEAVRMACGRIEQATLERLKQSLVELGGWRPSRKWMAAAVAVNSNLHGTIARECGSARLAEEICRYDVFVQSTGEAIKLGRQVLDETAEQHMAIVDAMLAADTDAAAAAMSLHLERAGQALEAAMTKPPKRRRSARATMASTGPDAGWPNVLEMATGHKVRYG